ncbi:MAG: MoxR family ATPase [Deltaproteobacteria bacterium]|nr:MoxR family ATPase [Deltaproteobacteria bacterium]
MDLAAILDVSSRLKEQVRRVVVGQDGAIELMLVALLAEGHVLLEGVPGTAKTLLARSFATGLSLAFNRIQFTPDLMPGDLIGTNLFNFQTNQFVLTKGPLFTEFLLADELNRTPPKTQAALLQAMQERAVTVDGRTHDLGPGFMVVATQNPIEQEGTYPLPEAQLDRFLFKIRIDYPSRDGEREMVRLHGHKTSSPRPEDFAAEAIATLPTLVAAREQIATIRLSEPLVDYVVDLVRATRTHPSLRWGASPRSANMLATAARAGAALAGRDFVLPDDIKALLRPALSHRIVLAPGAEIEGITAETVLGQIADQVPAPR